MSPEDPEDTEREHPEAGEPTETVLLVELWPHNGSRDQKSEVLSRIRSRPRSAEQTAILREAIARNEDAYIADDILCALLWLTGEESEDANGTYYDASAIDRVVTRTAHVAH